MRVERVTVAEAQRLLDAGYSYVDVRTPEEYAAGHPVGARNVPWGLIVGDRMESNAAFLTVMGAIFGLDGRIVLGCEKGQRSLAAASLMVDGGFSRVVEMRAGYGGIRDPFGQVVEKGWVAAGLPTELVTVGGSYAELQALVGE